MNKLLALVTIAILICICPSTAHAHTAGTLPYIKINGKYTFFNPTYQLNTTINAAQDVAEGKYLINRPISFTIDKSRLPFPIPITKQLSFRWSIYQGDNFNQQRGKYLQADNLTYTFPHAGSYLIQVDAKLPTDNKFSVIDTIVVNVFPTNDYLYPKASVIVQQDNQNIVTLTTHVLTDQSVQKTNFLWDLNNNKLDSGVTQRTGENLLNNFPKSGITARVIDDHGLITDVYIRQETFTRQLDYSTIEYSKGTATAQLGILSIKNTTDTNANTILGQPLTTFFHNLLIIFSTLLLLIAIRLVLSFYGQTRQISQ